ncbi:hypothetical protein BDA96_04G176400 [Sorghum bicolor]|uniref:Uncharacterized protein n=2 Tax=Sorghum bicolor TaxID=4558 RepID=A0A1Z5RMU1_SORBI|nr:hypothetical protein BDA96_04G176400 [Sorghum bicolor]OQU85050.1 hypothetical protein SORBI_3004G164650 [Sorghum bicolor]OQU85051.1 hypothetical protein SORBI_3004G164650 [Sorghum bicolor]OQU85052.1 hypothetical protein SORBI_3004G164650 [Sorghum bicolor]OQU85053.1 hypothetical protein SORBI_3004G164650 [Sorghum bicolor]
MMARQRVSTRLRLVMDQQPHGEKRGEHGSSVGLLEAMLGMASGNKRRGHEDRLEQHMECEFKCLFTVL